MQYQMTLYIADHFSNIFMKAADMKPEYKWYITPRKVTFETSTPITDDYFRKIMDLSKKMQEENGYWIPAIKFGGRMYAHKDVKQLSDGNRMGFINENVLH